MSNVKTYADGYGRWHAIVADRPLGLSRAVRAIADELILRAPAGQAPDELLEYVNREIVSSPDAPSGFIHFVEYRIEGE